MEPTSAKAVKTSSTFRLEYRIERVIRAKPARVWQLLTDASQFPRWNSTVSKLEGTIARGEKLHVETPSAPGRVFSPRVTELVPEKSMVWGDGMAPMFKGTRTFTLVEATEGQTTFSMSEEFTGLMLPMIRGSLPDFAPIFETYADDLARAAEANP